MPYSIVAVTKVRTAELPLAAVGRSSWNGTPRSKLRFEYEVMKLMSEVMAHTITLHLLDAPGRLSRFQRKHPELAGRIPKKELAAYLQPDAGDAVAPQAEARRALSRTGRPARSSGQNSEEQRERW